MWWHPPRNGGDGLDPLTLRVAGVEELRGYGASDESQCEVFINPAFDEHSG